MQEAAKDSGKCRYIDGIEEDLVQKTTYIMLDQTSFESAADPAHQRCWQQLYVLCAIVRHGFDCRASLVSTVITQTYLLTYDKQWKVSVTRRNGRNTSVYPCRRRPPSEVGVSSVTLSSPPVRFQVQDHSRSHEPTSTTLVQRTRQTTFHPATVNLDL